MQTHKETGGVMPSTAIGIIMNSMTATEIIIDKIITTGMTTITVLITIDTINAEKTITVAMPGREISGIGIMTAGITHPGFTTETNMFIFRDIKPILIPIAGSISKA